MSGESVLLVVHSAPETAERITEALRTTGSGDFAKAKVVSAATVEAAMQELESCSPDVIFVEMGLSDSRGLGTLRAIRKKCPASPIIVLVDEKDHAVVSAALGNGAQDYLYTPEDRGEVIGRSITRAVERRKAEQEHSDIGWRSGIGETALSIRHEINNPLAALMLNLEMLKEGGHDDAGELLEGIEIAAKRIAAVVRRLEGLRTPQRIPAIGGEAMVDLSGDNSSPGARVRKASARDAAGSIGSGSTILLVDDEESVRAIVTKILGRHGHKVMEAEHGADALRLAAGYDGQIDLLISDMYMPGLRGPEILEKLKTTRPELRVLFMSGYGDEDVARSGVEPGSGFLRKPFTVQELSEAVTKALTGPATT